MCIMVDGMFGFALGGSHVYAASIREAGIGVAHLSLGPVFRRWLHQVGNSWQGHLRIPVNSAFKEIINGCGNSVLPLPRLSYERRCIPNGLRRSHHLWCVQMLLPISAGPPQCFCPIYLQCCFFLQRALFPPHSLSPVVYSTENS